MRPALQLAAGAQQHDLVPHFAREVLRVLHDLDRVERFACAAHCCHALARGALGGAVGGVDGVALGASVGGRVGTGVGDSVVSAGVGGARVGISLGAPEGARLRRSGGT